MEAQAAHAASSPEKDTKEQLLAAFGLQPGGSQMATRRAADPAVAAEAHKAWEAWASSAGFGSWATQLKEEAQKDIDALRAAGGVQYVAGGVQYVAGGVQYVAGGVQYVADSGAICCRQWGNMLQTVGQYVADSGAICCRHLRRHRF